ncbi:Alkaline phosphatase synthesis transcriptional regulatory protein PhoP [Pontiella desulfatans]|uniref:Alkaline phosphatase synthesis transcriptional regulatory protein PhoP n=1 Tax=Pontiella desulfatans TaxID=2750659 RepID=A0A6C2UCL9_PONDE|nr:response regulator transcription factor [Pontiella desulfatans]VGO17928.1 Alkaline phosphatase synthesis transcriptional regulatory protein PhoP [Pontiella desulfatans]
MAGETILIVEDDAAMMRGLKDNFEYSGYNVVTACEGEQGLETALNLKPDLILLDLMLPGINGYEICRLIRAEGVEIPIIMLTAKSQESDIVLGLNIGANDYVTKPFSIKELLARVNAMLRNVRKPEAQVFSFGECELNLSSQTLSRSGKAVELTPKELGLLTLFVKHPGQALTRDQILNAVWGYDIIVTQRSVDRCINSLRHKVGNPNHIQTVREIGYRFELGADS